MFLTFLVRVHIVLKQTNQPVWVAIRYRTAASTTRTILNRARAQHQADVQQAWQRGARPLWQGRRRGGGRVVPARQAADEESGDAGLEERKVYTSTRQSCACFTLRWCCRRWAACRWQWCSRHSAAASAGRSIEGARDDHWAPTREYYSASSQSPRCHQSKSVLPVTVNREALAVCLCSFAREPLAATPSWWGLSHL